MSNGDVDVLALYAGLSWNIAAFRNSAVFFPTGVRGGSGGGGALPKPRGGDPPGAAAGVSPSTAPRRSSDAARDDAWGTSSSGSTSSSSRSAALSACSARARIASSTIGWGTPAGGELVPVESALEGGGRELLERGENDAAERACGAARSGGYISYGVEKETRFIDVSMSMSESLSSGMGILDASRSESSSNPRIAAMLMDSRFVGCAASCCGSLWDELPCKGAVPGGGDAGRAVCIARRSVELPFGDPARGDDTRRR